MSATRHTILAYLLLFSLLSLLFKVVFLPLLSAWQQQAHGTHTLRAEVLSARSLLAEAKQNDRMLESELRSLFESGKLGFSVKANDVGHHMQERIKLLLAPLSIQIVQLRPSNVEVSKELSKSVLELNIRLRSEALQPLLNALSHSVPSLHIDILSIRSNAKHSTQLGNDLELSVTLATWYVGDASFAGKLDGLALAEIEAPNSTDRQSILERNILAGLFDINTRVHFASPSPTHYRLAAINVSKSTRIAIIANTVDGRIRRLEQGELLDAWLVESIDSDGVNLTYQERSEVLKLSQ